MSVRSLRSNCVCGLAKVVEDSVVESGCILSNRRRVDRRVTDRLVDMWTDRLVDMWTDKSGRS